MAYPSVTNTFLSGASGVVSGATCIASRWNTNFSDVISGLSDGTKDLKLNNATASGNLSITGNLYTTAFTDYSASSTIYGFASYISKGIYYKKIGNTVYVFYLLSGIGVSGTYENYLRFSLPYVTDNLISKNVYNCIDTNFVVGNVKAYGSGKYVAVSHNISTIQSSPSPWTSSAGKTKSSSGSFCFEVS
jgi:hypothetical protein